MPVDDTSPAAQAEAPEPEKAPLHPATEAILRYFESDHLPKNLQVIAQRFERLAWQLADDLEGPEFTAGLRKLLEAKDCMVRASLP